MKFTPVTDPTEMPKNGSGNFQARGSGKGTKYGPGGPGSGVSGLGPNATTTGPAGASPVDFKGEVRKPSMKAWPEARSASTPGELKK